MRVHEFEGAMFEDEIEYYAHYMGWWAVCGQQVLVFFHEVNHGCYAFFVWNVCVQGYSMLSFVFYFIWPQVPRKNKIFFQVSIISFGNQLGCDPFQLQCWRV